MRREEILTLADASGFPSLRWLDANHFGIHAAEDFQHIHRTEHVRRIRLDRFGVTLAYK